MLFGSDNNEGSNEAEPEVVAAVGTGGVVFDPVADALVVEAVEAAGEEDAGVVYFELHEADRA